MVKRIAFLMMFLLSLSVISAYDYVAEDTTIVLVEQVDTDNMTRLTYRINSTPGNYEISSSLGRNSIEQVAYYENYENEFTLSFEKVLSGNKNFLLMVYRDDALIVFASNETIAVKNNVTLSAGAESIIENAAKLQIVLTIDTNLNLEDSKLKIKSGDNIYTSEDVVILDSDSVSYIFSPKTSGAYSYYSLDVNGYVVDLSGSLGNYDFSVVKNFADEKTESGLLITFDSICACEKEISVFGEDSIVYSTITNDTSILISNEEIANKGLNGPYTIYVNVNGTEYSYITSAYNYTDFAATVEKAIINETIVNETVVNETKVVETLESNPASSATSSTKSVEEEKQEVNETIVESINISVEENSNLNTTSQENETVESEVVEEVSEPSGPSVFDKAGDGVSKLTGLVVSTLKQGKKSLSIFGILLLVIIILGLFYIKQKREGYLYDM